MVSLAVAESSSPPLNNQPNEIISLRDSALWFPSIPESHLQLNEANFTGMKTATSGFRPLCCIFGDVANPTVPLKVSVTSESYQAVAIDCHYSTGNVKRLGPQYYCTMFSKTAGYLVERTVRGNKDAIIFVKNGELRRPDVSNYSQSLRSLIERVIYILTS